MAADVFISYAREDRSTAERLAKALAARGHSVWWDRDIQVGSSYTQVIERELQSAGCVIVLWSQASADSGWVRDEAQSGSNRHVLVPALLDGGEPPLGFRSMQTADLSGWVGEADHPGAEQLFAAVRALTGKPTGDGTIHPPPPVTPSPPTPPRRPGFPKVWLAAAAAALLAVGGALFWFSGGLADCGTGSGTVYIQYPASVSRQTAEALRGALNAAGFNAPGTQKVDETPSQMQIRYFDAAQQPQVKTLGCVLAKQGYKSVEVQPNLGGKSSPLEVWFAGQS